MIDKTPDELRHKFSFDATGGVAFDNFGNEYSPYGGIVTAEICRAGRPTIIVEDENEYLVMEFTIEQAKTLVNALHAAIMIAENGN